MQFGNLAGVRLHFGGAIVRWNEQPPSPTPTYAKGLYSLFTQPTALTRSVHLHQPH